jgi:hypothetical protein
MLGMSDDELRQLLDAALSAPLDEVNPDRASPQNDKA